DCTAREGNFLGEGDQPIVTCQAGTCDLGACCVDGECNDKEFGTFAACEGQEGIYVGGLTCDDDPCPACPFNSVANCQQVQTIFGRVPMMDRNPENYGAGGASMHADDVKFGGAEVDQICWNVGFFNEPCCGNGNCDPNIDGTWQIRVYESDPDCDAFPGPQIGQRSIISVLNRIEGTGQGIGTWHYSGELFPPITLDNPGLAGDTYWFEITAFGEDGCGVRATWSRDHGNEHIAQAIIGSENEIRDYQHKNIEEGPDLGFCENSGIATPDMILGSCCVCPGNCQDDLASADCDQLGGFWTACESCATRTAECGDPPANDDCSSPELVTDVPASADGSAFITVAGQNICATDDGPPVSDDDSDPDLDRCLAVAASIPFAMHDDVWYEYVATDCGDLRINSCDTTDQDMMIAIYDGSSGCPVLTSDELACDLNGCEDFFDTDVTLRVAAGQELLIRIGGLNNEVAGGFTGDPRGSWTTQWSLALACNVLEPPSRAASPHDILKNRYISVDPRGAGGNNPPNLHIRLEVDSSEVNGQTGSGPWWAGPPDAECISIVTKTKPDDEPDWSGCPAVHLTGCPIVPTTAYEIRAESLGVLSDPGLESFFQCFDGAFPAGPRVVCDPANGDPDGANNTDCTSIPCVSNGGCPFVAECQNTAGTECKPLQGDVGCECFDTSLFVCQQSLLRTQLKPGASWHGDCIGTFTGT
ncbi:MAG: hypothetical protein IIC51_12310, partial [Planctomycetes bacterium]|nr:hypothetical protein [Planctomycetota bacterium]